MYVWVWRCGSASHFPQQGTGASLTPSYCAPIQNRHGCGAGTGLFVSSGEGQKSRRVSLFLRSCKRKPERRFSGAPVKLFSIWPPEGTLETGWLGCSAGSA